MSDLKCTTVFATTVVLQDMAELDTRASRKVGFSQQVTDPLPDCKQKESPEDIGETDPNLRKSALEKLLEDMAHKFKSSLGDIGETDPDRCQLSLMKFLGDFMQRLHRLKYPRVNQFSKDETPNKPFGQLSRSMQKYIGCVKEVRPSVLEQLGVRPDKVYQKYSRILYRYEKCYNTDGGGLFISPS